MPLVLCVGVRFNPQPVAALCGKRSVGRDSEIEVFFSFLLSLCVRGACFGGVPFLSRVAQGIRLLPILHEACLFQPVLLSHFEGKVTAAVDTVYISSLEFFFCLVNE